MKNLDAHSENKVADKSFEFAVRIVNLNKFLTGEQKEYVMSRQILRCGTSIGANIAEAKKDRARLILQQNANRLKRSLRDGILASATVPHGVYYKRTIYKHESERE